MKGLVTIHDAESQTRFTAFLDAQDELPLASVLPSLTSMVDSSANVYGVAVDGRLVSAETTLRDAGMHEGSWISLLGRDNAVMMPYVCTDRIEGFVQLRIVSGVGAGTVFDVSQGTISVGALFRPEEHSVNADFMLDVSSNGDVRLIPHIYAVEKVKVRGLFRRHRMKPKSGVFIDGEEIVAPMDLPSGTEIVLPECIVTVTRGRAVEIPLDKNSDEGHWLFARPPKIRDVVRHRKFTLPGEPQKPEKAPIPLVATLMPLAMSAVMVVLMKNYTYLMFGLMSPVMMISSFFSGNYAAKKKYKKEMKRYEENVAALRKEARKAVDAESVQARREYPDPTQVLDICARHTARLWNRRSTDESWLRLRIGTGETDSHVTLEDPQKMEFERVRKWKLREFPITVSLADSGCVGCTGNSEILYPVVSWMTMQLAALHSTRDLAMYLLTPRPKDRGASAGVDWSFAQWLPQLSPHFGQNAVRNIGVGAEDLGIRISELISMLDERKTECRRQSITQWSGSAVVIIMERAHVLRSMPGVIRLLQEGPVVGMYSLCVDTDERLLPEECQTVVTATQSVLRVESNAADDIYDIMPDVVSGNWLHAMAGALAPIEDGSPAEGQSAIPDHSRLLDLLELSPTADQIEARWLSCPRSTSCLIGESVDGPFGLDISKDGPHGLIAGTTGSGKSELLQSLVASLAVANTPESLNFVLVDYKGGAAFKDCVKLPHTVGMVTDLDNHLVSRALTSLGAELNYREHLLAKAGAKDLEDYIDMRDTKPMLTPIPRLLIVIDEFASLARELPDFVTGLVNIAQRGRSLGIHLLLATQRPGGVVSPEIRANTNLRIALRMTDIAESQDVIDAKDAALISKSTPGRAVVRLGSNSLIPFQSARVGGRYVDPSKHREAEIHESPFVRSLAFGQLGLPVPQRAKRKKTSGNVDVTDLKVLVDCVNVVAERERIPKQRQPWLPALSEQVDVDDLKSLGEDGDAVGSGNGVVIPFALGDYPARQKQTPVMLDMRHFGNLFIVGTSRSGKSTALKTILYEGSRRYSPRVLQMYCIDAGNGSIAPVSALPNVGAVALRSETQKIERLIGKLETEVKRRAALLSKDGYSSIDEYNGSCSDADDVLPHIIVVLDSWDGFNVVFQSYDNGSLIDRLQILMREGVSSGVHAILTGDRSLLAGRMSLLADSKILLRLVDPTDYADVGMSSRDVPEHIPNGRGYRSEDGAELQIAQIRKGMTGQEESEAIRLLGRALRKERDHGLSRRFLPFAVEQLPEEISLDDVYSLIEDYQCDMRVRNSENMRIPLGLGGEDNEPILFDPSEMAMLPIYGTMQSGKTTMSSTIINGAMVGGYHVVVAAPKNNALRRFAGMEGVEELFTSASSMTEDALSPYLARRDVLFVFDDCQLLRDMPAANWLQNLIGTLDADQASFVFAGDVMEFPTGFGSWGSRVKSLRQGILLRPDELMYQDLINIRLKRSEITSDMPLGRGYLHIGSKSLVMQTAFSTPDFLRSQGSASGRGFAHAEEGNRVRLTSDKENSHAW